MKAAVPSASSNGAKNTQQRNDQNGTAAGAKTAGSMAVDSSGEREESRQQEPVATEAMDYDVGDENDWDQE
jgi:hypothetical protein